MRDFTDDLRELHRRVSDANGYLRIAALRERLGALEADASRPDLWDDVDAARRVTTELAQVKDDIGLVERLEGQVSDVETLAELAREEGDVSLEPEILEGITALRDELDRLELRALFTGEHDELDGICTIQSGAGGTDAQDWAQMMLRMFTRWAERQGFAVTIDDVSLGEEAGITSATFRFAPSDWAYWAALCSACFDWACDTWTATCASRCSRSRPRARTRPVARGCACGRMRSTSIPQRSRSMNWTAKVHLPDDSGVHSKVLSALGSDHD